jgi:transcriptional regulator with XRE-family HTH domain
MFHRGQIVEKFVRKSGYSLSKLADKLHISRNTLYNRFSNANLSYRFIQEVGVIINYDFSFDFLKMPKGDLQQGKRLWYRLPLYTITIKLYSLACQRICAM